MSEILFSTSNPEKTLIAKTICSAKGLNVEQISLDIDEIQGEDPKVIVEDKVRKAYQKIKKAVVVSDDSWDIPALNGFPGPYMKSLNHWFKAEDFLRLMDGINDRTVLIHQYLSYFDGKNIYTFKNDFSGKVTLEPRGKNDRSPSTMITELDIDNGKTIAELFEEVEQGALINRYLTNNDVWHEFVTWYLKTKRA
jgi:XTP/dITP diphosphohydrolase